MSVDKISVYLEAHYWILIVVFFVSLLIIIRLFVKNLNKENLEKLIKKKTLTRTSFDTKLENEESFSLLLKSLLKINFMIILKILK